MITGHYFDGQTSATQAVSVEITAGMVRILGTAQPILVPLHDVRISERIANVPRRFTLPDGAVIETTDNEAVDQACVAAGVRLRSGLVHWLESRWPVAMASLVAVALLTVGFLRWGMPVVVHWAASAIPAELDVALGGESLDTLDRLVFTESRLPPERQRELQRRFTEMTSALQDGHRYELVLRNGGGLGANAFALPAGIVVVTDQLVELAESDDEIVAVMAHEIGHVRERHALRHLLEVAGISAMAMALLGDVGQISSVLTAAPALLVARQSREFEREADAFAKQWLRDHGIAESNFDAILCRMNERQGQGSRYDYFSSHPPLDERARCEP